MGDIYPRKTAFLAYLLAFRATPYTGSVAPPGARSAPIFREFSGFFEGRRLRPSRRLFLRMTAYVIRLRMNYAPRRPLPCKGRVREGSLAAPEVEPSLSAKGRLRRRSRGRKPSLCKGGEGLRATHYALRRGPHRFFVTRAARSLSVIFRTGTDSRSASTAIPARTTLSGSPVRSGCQRGRVLPSESRR